MSPCFPVLSRARKGREGKIPAPREAPPCRGVAREMGAACCHPAIYLEPASLFKQAVSLTFSFGI